MYTKSTALVNTYDEVIVMTTILILQLAVKLCSKNELIEMF
jgi:hypothetical protein